jgi:hypothetical protein
MIDDLTIENEEGTTFDLTERPTGIYIDVYDDWDNFMGSPLTIEDIKKIRDYLSKVIDDLENNDENRI